MPSGPSASRPPLILATLNRSKGHELASLLDGIPFDIRLLADTPGARLPEETEDTYRGNALLKARATAGATGHTALADDSGLEVDALDGAPGVRSARFGGAGLDDAGRTALLLKILAERPGVPRSARFRCVIAIVDTTGHERIVEGAVEGVIAPAPRGRGGFGYDPVFVYPPFGRTFAELTDEDKSRVSHRAAAARAARTVLIG